MHHQAQQAEGVDHDVPFTAGGPLAHVEPAALAALTGLHRLGAGTAGRWVRVAAVAIRTWSRNASWTRSQVPSRPRSAYQR